MKKAFSLLAVFMVAVMWSATGFSAEKYVSGNIGISWMNDIDQEYVYSYEDDYIESIDTGSGITLTGAFGCDYGDFRAEAELGYQTNDAESYTFIEDGDEYPYDITGDVSVTSLMANGYYDIDLGGVELFLTAGVGVAQVNFDELQYTDEEYDYYTFSTSETALAYQLGAGLGIPVSDGIMLDARYRYFATTDFTVASTLGYDDAYNANIESHSALLGLRVSL